MSFPFSLSHIIFWCQVVQYKSSSWALLEWRQRRAWQGARYLSAMRVSSEAFWSQRGRRCRRNRAKWPGRRSAVTLRGILLASLRCVWILSIYGNNCFSIAFVHMWRISCQVRHLCRFEVTLFWRTCKRSICVDKYSNSRGHVICCENRFSYHQKVHTLMGDEDSLALAESVSFSS